MATSFDLFDTLLSVPRPADPAAAVAAELDARDVTVPTDWASAYREPHVDVPDGAELPLPAHVAAALRSRGVDPTDGDGHGNAVRRAVVAAFDPTDVDTHPDAPDAVRAAARVGPVCVLSNCSVPGLVRRALRRSALDADAFDEIVTSVACGWRKPDRRAFAAVAGRLDVPLADLRHVGDDPRTDGGADAAGAHGILVDETPLAALPDRLGETR
ncbi:FMN phosphatase YigB (HAD superfamily) [Halarchaeum rubridurum]|uniref:FMN phosphatase YigB (HAD superfamily) n=1 Tax=Halarchaeum rubridurum TaxID=489911 RepID=A0A830FXP6_9EURY|nr:HAD family hydrolase [Halarchaeum rubridurum]MBP1954495.1 FMN phosphatase YigB (HAD superfamily) [Halarchaeum rubridurum]GGM61501.1 HAD family hydrolase [Halarchaeum rubridurum]